VFVDEEVPLDGGYVTGVVRVGDTVRRTLGEKRPFVQDLLGFLEDAAWAGAPRFLGFDREGRQMLSWIEGHVPWSGVDEAPTIYDEASVAGVARLVREMHDLTAGTVLAGTAEVVCHNDLSLRNTVYRELGDRWLPVAFLDWDLAAPGLRIDDVAHLCWQWAANTTVDVDTAATLVRTAADAYGLARSQRGELIESVLRWQDRCWRGIEQRINRGDPTARRLEAAGAVEAIRADWNWTVRNRAALEGALS
jgi:hypothetical protein